MKKHTYEDRLKYMSMLKDGYSIKFIGKKFGIDRKLLACLWHVYQKNGPDSLRRKKTIRTDGNFKQKLVLDIEKNGLTLVQASLKYDVSASHISVLLKRAREEGMDALLITNKLGRPRSMGRPKKKKPETELEKLRDEVLRLKIENELLKKVKALVEARRAHLYEIGHKPSKD
jgi:transposase